MQKHRLGALLDLSKSYKIGFCPKFPAVNLQFFREMEINANSKLAWVRPRNEPLNQNLLN